MGTVYKMNTGYSEPGSGLGALAQAFFGAPVAARKAEMEAAKIQSLVNSQMLAGEKNAEETRGLRITNDLRDGTANIQDYLAKANPNFQNLRPSELAALQGFTMLGKDMRNHSQSLNDYQEYYDREAIKSNPNLAPKINAAYFATEGSDPRMKLGENDRVSNLFGGGGGQVGVDGVYISSKKKEGQDNLNFLLDDMEQKYGIINSSGGIVSTKKSPLQNAISFARSNEYIGRPFGSVVGSDEESKRKEIESARTSVAQAIMKATGMSAKQLDSNAELKLMLNSIGSPGHDIESNMAIINRLRVMYGGKDKNQLSAGSNTKSASAKVPKSSKAPPPGIDPAYWDEMSDEDKALWR